MIVIKDHYMLEISQRYAHNLIFAALVKFVLLNLSNILISVLK